MKILQTIVLVLFSSLHTSVDGTCSRHLGPSGSHGCVRLHYYHEYQSATCVSNAYLKAKWNNYHHCRDHAKYCWAQCMTERYNISSGPVYKDCQCVPATTVTTPLIPNNCNYPSGKNCSWFDNCFDKMYSCNGTSVTEIKELSLRLCHANTPILKLSTKGLDFVAAVKKCFPFFMAPVLKLHHSCTAIENIADEVRKTCLSKPFGGISLCELGINDIWTMFWSFRNEYATTFIPGLHSFSKEVQRCAQNYTYRLGFISVMKKIKLYFKASVRPYIDITIAEKYLSQLAEVLQLKDNGIMWYADLNEDTCISILFAIRDPSTTFFTSFNASVETAIKVIRKMVKTGETQLYINGFLVNLESVFSCQDFECLDPNHTVVDGK